MTPEMLQLGATFTIAMALIELIKWVISLFSDKNQSNKDVLNKEVFEKMTAQLELMNTNHLNHIEGAINTGNDKIVSALMDLRIDLAKFNGNNK